MIKTFRHKELAKFWSGERSKIGTRFHKKLRIRLNVLDAATSAEDLDLPGYYLHQLQGHKPTRYSVRVTGNWRLTFEFHGGDAHVVDFEDYH